MTPMSMGGGVRSQDNGSEYLGGVSSQDNGPYEHFGGSAHRIMATMSLGSAHNIMAPMSIWRGGGGQLTI